MNRKNWGLIDIRKSALHPPGWEAMYEIKLLKSPHMSDLGSNKRSRNKSEMMKG